MEPGIGFAFYPSRDQMTRIRRCRTSHTSVTSSGVLWTRSSLCPWSRLRAHSFKKQSAGQRNMEHQERQSRFCEETRTPQATDSFSHPKNGVPNRELPHGGDVRTPVTSKHDLLAYLYNRVHVLHCNILPAARYCQQIQISHGVLGVYFHQLRTPKPAVLPPKKRMPDSSCID